MPSVTNFWFKDQISTLSTKPSNAKNTYLFWDYKLGYTLAVISDVANLILVSAYDKYLSLLRLMSQNYN